MKRSWGILLCAIATVCVLVVLFCRAFPERFFVAKSADSIEAVEIVWGTRGVPPMIVTDERDIEEFYHVLSKTSDLQWNLFPHHMEGLSSNPVYSLKIYYTNGDSDFVTTQEGGRYIYKYVGSKTDHGDKGYVQATNPQLLDWVKQQLM